MANPLAVLQKATLFRGVAAGDLEKLAALAREEIVAPGHELFREGAAGDALYIVSGSYFGEMALVDDDHKRSATVAAKEPTTVHVYAREGIEKLCESDAPFGRNLYRALARGLARRLAVTTTDAAFYRSQSRKND